MNLRDLMLPLIAVVAAVAYWQGIDFDSKATSIALKMSPALAMALEVFRQRRCAAGSLVAALVVHAVGDGLLNLGSDYLLMGMGAFFLGHLGYIAAFLPHRYPAAALPGRRRMAIVVLIVAMLALTIYIWPLLRGPLAIASPIYSAALTAMAAAALLGRWRGPWVVAGALLFVLSDVVLGLRLFAGQTLFAPVIWPAYAAAQILMPLGYLATPRLSAAGDSGTVTMEPANRLS
ncbi:MAG: lysoplasmalogenase [Planctomycetaceae bacterium]|nr:lysoplasmalogenase [Planctomycetaceae bacterium]